MILTFADWKLSTQRGASLGHQYDNLTNELTVQGGLPEGWEWDILVSAGGNGDTWHLTPGDGQASITLTEDNLSVSGEYYLQLRGIKGEQVRHTNIVTACNFRSLSGAGQWPTLPTEWIQAERDIKELNAHPPVPGEDGYWQLWDLTTHSYQPSQLVVPGLSIQAGTVTTLEPGQPATVKVVGDGPDYQVDFGIPQGKPGKNGKDGAPGKDGTDGAPGKDGQTPTITVGEVKKLEPDQDPTASITGETPNLMLNLGIPQGQPGKDGVQLNDDAINATEAWSSKKIVDTLCPSFSVSGNPVTCNPVEDYPLSAVVTLEPKQAGTGDPSPENVRPITGRNEVTVTRCGKNLFNGDDIDVIQNGISIKSNGDGTYHITGTNTSDGWISVKIGEINIPAGTYVFSGSNSPSPHSMRIRMLRTQIGGLNGDNADNPLVQTITGGTSRVYIQVASGATIDILSNPMLELGSTPTDYEPYQGDTYDISLPETIYGGTVDAVTGVGSKTWGFIASYNGESLPGEWISDRDVYTPETTPTTGAQVAYKLATPEPFQATGNQPIPALAGENTVYTDGNSLAVSGRKDPTQELQSVQMMKAQLATMLGKTEEVV